jgi:hypothetical protein
MLERVEQNVADVGPLSDTLRSMDFQVDLRNPVGFNSVYRVPGRDDLLMRASGALHAIFPQSVYVDSREGLAAQVPAGTVFAIGMPGPWTMPPRQIQPALQPPASNGMMNPGVTDEAPHPLRRDTRVNTLVGGPAAMPVVPAAHANVNVTRENDDDPERSDAEKPMSLPPPDPSTILRTIATDEAYRTQRLAELLEHAVRAMRDR